MTNTVIYTDFVSKRIMKDLKLRCGGCGVDFIPYQGTPLIYVRCPQCGRRWMSHVAEPKAEGSKIG